MLRLLAPLALAAAFFAPPASSALAARGHVFAGTFAAPCVAEPCAPGTLKDPLAIAVGEQSQDIYVADQEAGRGQVSAFAHSGAFLFGLTGPRATGTGQLEAGSATVKSVATETGAFSVGEEIIAPGLESGTTVIAVDLQAATLELSAPATNSESAALSAHQSFSEPVALAVDNSCKEGTCESSDPSAGDLYVVDSGLKVVDKFTGGGEYLGQITAAGIAADIPAETVTTIVGVAVDSGGRLLVTEEHRPQGGGFEKGFDRFTNAPVNQFQSFSRLLGPGGSNDLFDVGALKPGLAVDGEANVYIHTTFFFAGTDLINEFTSSGHLLDEGVDPEPPSGVAVESPSNDVYIDTIADWVRYSSTGRQLERLAVPAGDGAGIAVDSVTGDVYVADASTGEIDVFVLEPPSAPTIESEGVSSVTANSASLAAEINPRGAATSYRFEYGPCATPATCATSPYESSVPVPDGQLVSGFEIESVAADLAGLLPATAYHYRVVAANEAGGSPHTIEGEEKSFSTQSALAAPLLPDGRRWEQVSPPDKFGANLYSIGAPHVIQSAAAGDAITYLASAPTEAQPPGNSDSGVQVLSRRTVAGWASQDIATPHETASGSSTGGEEYKFCSADLSLCALRPIGDFTPSVSSEASAQTPYLRHDFPPGNVGDPCLTSCFRPLLTGKEGFANVPEGTVLGGAQLAFLGASPDLGHVVIQSSVGLTKTPGDDGGIYEWSAGRLQLISILPGGEPVTEVLLGRDKSPTHAISADGSRVFFATTGSGEHGLYMRDTAAAETVRLDFVQAGASGAGTPSPEFQTASADGSLVVFSDTQRLTADAGAAPNEPDLYQCQILIEAGKPRCNLTDLTPLGAREESAGVQAFNTTSSTILGASADASYVYFAANGVLGDGAAHGAKAGECQRKQASATCNLYLSHEGAISFIATLSSKDSSDWLGNLGRHPAGVSPNGHWLAFDSQRSLTGYDNTDALSGKPDQEVYLYHAPAGGGEGTLGCASCNPTGARPHGQEIPIAGGVGGASGLFEPGSVVAANLPGWTDSLNVDIAVYQSRYLNDQGRLFFNAADALVPADSNNTEDVYEYEPPGIGDCSTSSPTFGAASGGCVNLISSGTSKEESGFLDASESGNDVFFLTNAKLTSSDIDTSRDVYDAHVCSASSPCLPEPPPPAPTCAGDACQPPATPPSHPTPGTALLNGPGNLNEGAKKKHKHQKHHKRKHHKRAAGHKRGGGK